MSRLQTLTNLASVSQAAWEAWRRLIAAVGIDWRAQPGRESDPELSYLRAVARSRSDPPEASERRFAQLLEAHPASFHAMEEHGLMLDRMGQRDVALVEYERARRGRQSIKRGMPTALSDRPLNSVVKTISGQ